MNDPRRVLMTVREVIELMATSSSPAEWRANSEAVKLLHGGVLPDYWERVIFGSGLAHRKEREWQVRGFQDWQVRAGQVNGRATHREIISHVDVSDGPLGLPIAAVRAVRRAMESLQVTPHEWTAAVASELSYMLGSAHATCAHGAPGFGRIMEDLLRAVRGTAWDVRARVRQAGGLPDDRPPNQP